jgi:hypothetical protein
MTNQYDEIDRLLEEYATAITTNAGDAWQQEENIANIRSQLIKLMNEARKSEVEGFDRILMDDLIETDYKTLKKLHDHAEERYKALNSKEKE